MGTVGLKWVAGQMMVGADSNGTPLVMASWPEKDPVWRGLKPSDLLLLAAASCSTYDVVMIMDKQRAPLAGLEVQCSGEQLPDPPYSFTKIHLHYIVQGVVEEKKLAKAIQLSEEKYCSVINTFKDCVKVTHSYEIIE